MIGSMNAFQRRIYLYMLAGFILQSPASHAGALTSSYEPIPDAVWNNMQGRSWRADLPCAKRDELALMHLPYHDFTGAAQMGDMIVAKTVAPQVARIFNEIFKEGHFRIYQMQLIDAYNGDDDQSIAANNTSGFNCRLTDHGGLSKHALGLAIDINPIQNPYREGDLTAPEAGKPYDRPEERQHNIVGMIHEGDNVIRAFARQGWSWGGRWKHTVDYQHFFYNGH